MTTHPPSAPQEVSRADRSAAIAVTAFPAFILAGAALAFFVPEPFAPLRSYITYFLMIIMFGMGLTLTIPDFKTVAKRPIPVVIGVVAQFVIMPLGAVAVAKLLNLDSAIAVGLLMLGSVPGGTASNVIAYLAKGDVALSVAMTSVSTLVAPIMTPIIMLLLAGENVDVNARGMAWTLAQTVLLPVLGGLVLRYLLDAWMEKIAPVLPWISIIGIGGVVFPTVAANRSALLSVGLIVFVAVILHNVLGFLLGYFSARFTGLPESYRRTVAIEVGTQSAGLASGMAGKFFTPEAALPGAVAAVMHNINGAIYASIVRRFPTERDAGVDKREAVTATAR
ncbi:bile acid:Na+ symporter, BASS family [Corynebacterium mycetoides]|uniref:Bile acid:Na+ symporter, BASS family n=1 Tax=Corynebacterium mycetoides TaxID=38302 RepID=A0A1G9LPQ9_9CORY|nr:bile acid:sodium symporter family protein [Corynebacterium mycetoides]SDL63824.1 bile acid:Na+ symporter, BASS family [Corynebacterium mycetoides]